MEPSVLPCGVLPLQPGLAFLPAGYGVSLQRSCYPPVARHSSNVIGLADTGGREKGRTSSLLAAGVLLASSATCCCWQRRCGCRGRQVRIFRTYTVSERNRGLDPKRLLDTMRVAGIGKPRVPELPPPSKYVAANSRDAALMMLEKRKAIRPRSSEGLSPVLWTQPDYRLPLVLKYHKPSGMVTRMRTSNARQLEREDLRSVLVQAEDRFELDLYHPVGMLGTATSGLYLWSRSGHLTKQLCAARRGVVHELEAEVLGVVDWAVIREQLMSGVPLGHTGFQKIYHADVTEAHYLTDSALQDPRSRLVLRTRDAKAKIPAILRKLGHKVVKIKQTLIGAFALGSLEDSKLEAASAKEEAWACKFAVLDASEYPPGFAPEADDEMPSMAVERELATW
eukprot:TRINITY_DN48921_c0_g1_i1.p1 TRINITY_DN48921_c0_g1~~TRINITY_DN48921_c0_g1_i1.p1  ORF type:complete len:395 (-),score=66.21 TRINITY_DN48921_c0_g1_i1:3-1187(-)